MCKQLGITGYSTVRRELMEKVKELPEIYQKIAEKTKNLDKVVEFYSAFVEFTFGQQCYNDCVPIIKHVIGELFVKLIVIACLREKLYKCDKLLNIMFKEKGNTTMFEYTYGEAPTSIIEPPLNIKADEDENNERTSANADVNV